MTEHGNALRMRLELARMAQKHRVASDLYVIPLTEPIDHDLVVEGFASHTSIDLCRQCFSKHAFTIPEQPIPLLVKHDPAQIAGTIHALTYERDGNLRIKAVVTHELAKRCGGFSVGADVVSYQIHHPDSPDYCAEIKQATLREISVTDCPANQQALVTDRRKFFPQVKFYDLAIRKVELLAKMVEHMRTFTRPSRQTPAPKPRQTPPRPHSPTQFASLVQAINKETHP